ncbi:MAG: OB-fold nucleic acid binding domain-containing protein [Phycisphaerales bacterium]|nr:MAG: OB-fold nucleic acid binding domain-containing protein [Phycisphaerales bacterium]
MKLTLTALSIVTALALFSCRQKEEQPQEQAAQPPEHLQTHQQAGVDLHTAVVQEVLQASAYTYLKVKENDRDFWIAVTKREIEPGKTIAFVGGLEMKNFESKDLQRTFETLYFVDRIAGDESPPTTAQQPASMSHQGKPVIDQKEISIEPVEGGISIGELFSNRDAYADKTVLIKGEVTKINRAIMGRNWVHLQDGTSGSGSFDLTVTTQDEVAVGDVVTFEGKITLNKDFGAGYSYEVIVEEAKKIPQ